MNTAANRPAEPWNRYQLVMLAALNGLGLVLLVVAWGRSRGEAEVGAQVPWLNLAVLAVVLSAGIDGLWLANGRRVLATRRRSVFADVAPPATPAVARQPVDAADLVAVPGGRRAHRGDCALVVGKTARPISVSAARSADLARCEVCQP